MESLFSTVSGSGVLDYVSGWYLKAAQYMHTYGRTYTSTSFVSTNSISQGEQVGVLWRELFEQYGVKILFAHRSFKWNNEARGNAAVHVVIIGFALFDLQVKRLFEYETLKDEPHEIAVKNINPYLVAGKDIFISKRRTPICAVPEMAFGSMPNDGGYFLFTNEEKTAFLLKEPNAERFFRRFMGAHEFINSQLRWCLWLKDVNPSELILMPQVLKRVDEVKK